MYQYPQCFTVEIYLRFSFNYKCTISMAFPYVCVLGGGGGCRNGVFIRLQIMQYQILSSLLK